MAQPLALTIGEPAGIGPDITINAWLRRNELKLPAFYLLGDREFLDNRATALGLKVRFADVRAEDAPDAFAEALPVVATGHRASAQPGQPDDNSADAATASIRRAGERGRHQSDCQERALPHRISASRPYRISRRTRGDGRPHAAAGDDVVVRCRSRRA